MAEHEDDKRIANPAGEAKTSSELPLVESPPLSPAGDAQTEAPKAPPTTALILLPTPKAQGGDEAPSTGAAPRRMSLHLRPRQKRQAILAASVVIAACLGAVIGSLTTGAFSPAPRGNVAGLEERKAMQQSITHLSKQVAILKASLDKAEQSTRSQAAKIAERLDHRPNEDITGSIAKPQSAPKAEVPLAGDLAAVPMPRPAPRIAAAESRPAVLPDWTIRDTQGGYIYVQGHGDVYQVVPGAPLPGLGPVQAIRRQNGRWIVVTPKGLIVSLRDRRFFE